MNLLELCRLLAGGRDGLRPSDDDILRDTVGDVGERGAFIAVGEVGVVGMSEMDKAVGARSTIAK